LVPVARIGDDRHMADARNEASDAAADADDRYRLERGSRARDHLANERTYLAWVRTSANVMIVGLAIAKFIEAGAVRAVVAGLALVALGGAGMVQGMVRYRRTNREIEDGRFVTGSDAARPLWAGGVLLVVLVAATLLVVL
jgi:putative membrane protein